MNKFKKIFGFLFLALFAFILVGCGSKKPQPEDPGTNPENPEQPGDPENPEQPGDPENPEQPEDPTKADQEKLEEQADRVYLGSLEEVANDLTLPKYAFGNKEFPISWASDKTNVIEVKEFTDAEKAALYVRGAVQMQLEETEVTLTATISYKELTTTRTFKVTVVADEFVGYSTIAAAKAKEDKTKDVSKIKFSGTVSFATGSGFIVSDETASFYCYGSNHGRKIGEEVTVRGTWTYYNNMVQIATGASVQVTGENAEFDLASIAEEKTISEIAAIKAETVDPVNSTRVFKTVFEAKANPAGSYNTYKLVDPKDSSKYLDVSKYNDSTTITEVGTLVSTSETKYYEGYVIIYCSRSAGSDGLWDVLYVPGSAVEKEVVVTDAEKVAGLVSSLKEQFNGLLVADNLELPTTDAKTGATIAWTSNNEAVISSTGVYAAPANKTTVVLTAEVTLNDEVSTVEITVTAKALTTVKNYVADARAAYDAAGADVADVRVEGVVTNVIGNSYYVQDGDAAIMIYNHTGHSYVAGDNVYVVGTVTVYNGLYELKSVTATGKSNNKYYAEALEITDYSVTALKGYDNALISIYDLTYVSGTVTVGTASNINFTDVNGASVVVRTDKFTATAEQEAIAAFVEGLTAGDKVNIVNANLGWYNGPQITPSSVKQFSKENTIRTVRNQYEGADIEGVTVKGVVTAIVGNSYYIQDGYYAMMIYNHANNGYAIGDNVSVTGTLTVYNGLYEIKSVTASEKVADEYQVEKMIVESRHWNSDVLAGCDSMVTSMYDLYYVSGSVTVGTSSSIKFEAADGTEVTVRTDKYMEDEAEQAVADLVATLKVGDKVNLVDMILGWYNGPQFTITALEQLRVNKIQGVRNQYEGADVEGVTVEGVVTAVIGNSYYVQDGDEAIMIYNHTGHGYVAGDVVSVTGTLTVYNGLYEIKTITASEKIEKEFEVETLELTEANYNEVSLNGKDNALVVMNGLQFVSGSVTVGSGSNIKFKTADGTEVTLRTDKYMDDASEEALATVVAGLKAGDIVNLKDIVLGWYNGPQLTPFSAESIEVVSSSTPEPEQPGTNPEQPGTEPEQPGTNPEQPALPGEAKTVSKQVDALITENGWTDATVGQEFALDSVVTVKIDGGLNSGKAYYGTHIRVYATDTPAGTVTISVASGYELASIKITTEAGTYAFLCVDGTSADISNVATSVSGTSVKLNAVRNGDSGKQVRIFGFEVSYVAK